MTVHHNPRWPARADEDLLLERPAPQTWRGERPPVQHDDGADERPVPARTAARSPSPLDTVNRGLGALIKLTLLLILMAVLWGIVATIDAGVRAPVALGEQIGDAVERGAGVAGAVGQGIVDAFDPTHPPRQALTHDVEIDELIRVNVGGPIAGSSTRDLTLTAIQRHADPAGPDAAVYAVLHGELREPQETQVLGVSIRSTRDPQDYYLYKGETLRIGQTLYKVNWVSMERQQLALIAYRQQDRVTAPLKVEID